MFGLLNPKRFLFAHVRGCVVLRVILAVGIWMFVAPLSAVILCHQLKPESPEVKVGESAGPGDLNLKKIEIPDRDQRNLLIGVLAPFGIGALGSLVAPLNGVVAVFTILFLVTIPWTAWFLGDRPPILSEVERSIKWIEEQGVINAKL